MRLGTALAVTDFEMPLTASTTLGCKRLIARHGWVTRIQGENASGKTTFMHGLAGLRNISSGVIVLNEKDVSRLSIRQRIMCGLAFVPQDLMIFRDLSVIDNLRLSAFSRKRSSQFYSMVTYLGVEFQMLQRIVDRKAGVLSGGEQKVVMIMRSLLGALSVLLLDEPFIGLYQSSRDEVAAVLTRLVDKGIAVIYTESDPSYTPFERIIDYCINDGQVAAVTRDSSPCPT